MKTDQELRQKAIDYLAEKGMVDTTWDDISVSVINLSDAEDFSVATVLWQTETGDDHTAVVRVVNQDGGLLKTHMVLYGLNVA